MLKVGRYTAALLLLSVGLLLLLDQIQDTSHMALLLDWWPMLLITLGVEYLVFNFIHRKKEAAFRLDWGGLILSVLISAVVVGITQADRLPKDWLGNLNFNIGTLNMSFSSESGYSFTKPELSIPLPAGVERIELENPNGSVEIRGGNVKDIIIQAVVWVDKVDESEAAQIAEESTIDYSGGSTFKILTNAKEYTGGFPNKRKPRVNLQVTVPEAVKADYQLKLLNGKAIAEHVPVAGKLGIKTTNGTITVTGIAGSIAADTTNGAVEVSDIEGDASVETTNGVVTVTAVGGKLEVDTTNGAVKVERVQGDADIETLNGKITVVDAAAGIKANATNGTISIQTDSVGGDYTLKNTTSSIELHIPVAADAQIKGSTSYGSISTNLPLTIEGKKISGTLGTGRHQIKIDTNNKIYVNSLD
ncbi:DUF4097 family beta strand repeat-containing protein [Paenibacillus sp. YN15]|uniref:DUF4097 family beta strand repeat-containing protein n=1 Tax=Paenibacillus sp. YN15 TaxID=1742774 RepID=UPI000DCB6A6F|nr:DUF4097 family beta strand repeat-containing protein [Paenibacillus sp. YN15]RAU95060.1 hypothetical protein DQG13_22600 [Paenibacillus sp. YN15]